jgi:hypothetical protein
MRFLTENYFQITYPFHLGLSGLLGLGGFFEFYKRTYEYC